MTPARDCAILDVMECPSAEDLAWFASGQADPNVERHIATCGACAQVAAVVSASTVSEAPRIPPAQGGEPREPSPGDTISRYVLLRRLGRGGMGVVVLAYDPVLDRMIALKLLRIDRASAAMSARLQREARSLAQITHANVVRVLDAGVWNGQVFLAMEHVEGLTLRAWLEARRRTPAEIVQVFVAVARGLAATHEAGFVHRDIKPDNILIGTDHVARLADFGLVEGGVDDRAEAGEPVPGVTEHPMTRPGVAVGTPAYMAPEQRAGGEVGPAADQFALCASLWEALFGVMPFSEASGLDINEPPGNRDVPTWLRDVTRRGLRATPAERWPSIDALIAALSSDPIAARRRRMARAGGMAAFAAVAALAVFGLSRGGRLSDNRCQGMEARLSGVWDPVRAAAVRSAFAATGRPDAGATFDRVARRLDEYTRAWVATRVETCNATHVRGEQSDALLDLRMACLDRRLGEVAALVDALASSASADVVDKAVQAVAQLPPLARCADAESLQALRPIPADGATRGALAELSAMLAKAQALAQTGQYRAGLPIATAAVARAEKLGYAPLLGEALRLRASFEEHTGDARAAQATLERALVAAADAHDDVLAARIWTEWVYVTALPLAHPDDAVRLQPGAQAALRRVGNPAEIEAELSRSLGIAWYAQGEYERAREALEHAVAVLEQAPGPDQPRLAVVLNALGIVTSAQGRYDDARRHYARALAIFERAVGDEHPDVAAVLTNMGIAASATGDHAAARRLHERAVAIWEKSLGPEHPHVAAGLTNLGLALLALGDDAEARDAHQRALAIRRKALDPNHPDIAVSLNNLGSVLQVRGDYAGARANHERALAIRRAALGADHPDVAVSLNNLADALAGEGANADALANYQRALAMWEKTLGPSHPRVAYALCGIAQTELALGHDARARAAAARAVEIREVADVPGEELARARFVLARTLWFRAGQRPRARSLAREAESGFAAAGHASRAELAEVRSWLRAHDAGEYQK